MTMKRVWVGYALLLGITLALVAKRQSSTRPPAGAMALPPTGPLTIAAGGDVVMSRPIARLDKDQAFDAMIGVVRGATVAITNLEMNLLEHAPRGDADGAGPQGRGDDRHASRARATQVGSGPSRPVPGSSSR